MSGERILVLDEETQRRGLNAFGLRCAGFDVAEASDVQYARSQIGTRYPHLLLIIAALLESWIQEFVSALREDALTRDLPVLALVEHEAARDAGYARECGIDDLIREPVSPEEFVARVRASVDRKRPDTPVPGLIADLQIDREGGLIRRGKRVSSIGPTEQRLLELLLSRPDQVVPRDLLLFRIWGGAANMRSRVLDVSVCRLRRALQNIGCEGVLRTVNRHGYKLAGAGDASACN
ncbi:MAG: winged helix-turn-helix domain-containing protein [Gammaproteobacteria bacterium]